MQPLTKTLQTLRAARYLTAYPGENGGIMHVELMVNGKLYGEQLVKHWQRAPNRADAPTGTCFLADRPESTEAKCGRAGFIHTDEFLAKMENLREDCDGTKCLTTVKTTPLPAAPSSGNIIRFGPSVVTSTHLVSDCFLNAAGALGKFYNTQRERKIWWMRLSANPGRYYVKPFDFQTNEESAPKGAKSITIKSRLPFGSLELERITMVPLGEVNSTENAAKAVIRAEVELEGAVCAMIFDGIDHSREKTLLLSRKLVPYQCAVACLHDGWKKKIPDLLDLCSHLHAVLRQIGLRVPSDNAAFTDCCQEFENSRRIADSIGIPYSLIIQDESLASGLVKLRSRDTTLEETIHISDISTYLLKIFTC